MKNPCVHRTLHNRPEIDVAAYNPLERMLDDIDTRLATDCVDGLRFLGWFHETVNSN